MIPELAYPINEHSDFNSETFVKQHITTDRATVIYQCIIAAINEYRTQYAGLRQKHSARTEASIIHDLIVNNIKNNFKDDHNTYCVTKRNLFLLGINNGAVIVRFKKMDKHLKVSNIPTQQSFDFNNQQFYLFGPSININAGYVPNGLELDVYFACPENNNKNSWSWPIKPEVSTFVPEIQPESAQETTRHAIPKGKERDEHVDTERAN
jgi:hypothetical protein